MSNSFFSETQTLSQLASYAHQFYSRGWMAATAGNLSAKLSDNPLEYAVTPSGVNKGELRPDDFLRMRPTLEVLRGAKGLRPSAETAIHEAIYKSVPEAGAVFHVHLVHAAVVSSGYPQPTTPQLLEIEWFEMLKAVGVGEEKGNGKIGLFPNWQDIPRVGNDIEHYLAEHPASLPAVLIYNHGLSIWGKTMEQARNHVEAFEYIFQYLYLKSTKR